MLESAHIMAFVATTDAARARSFYGTTLGLTLEADEEFALVFDANGTMLRVQKVQAVPEARYTTLGWRVDDIRGAVTHLMEKGIAFERFQIPGFPQDDLGIWTAPDGTQVAWFRDPDRNILSLTQFPPRPGKRASG